MTTNYSESYSLSTNNRILDFRFWILDWRIAISLSYVQWKREKEELFCGYHGRTATKVAKTQFTTT